MNSNLITFRCMAIVAVVLLFGLGPISTNLYGGHGLGPVISNLYGGHGFASPYGPCGGQPFTTIGGHIICTTR
jgi:hypothetical protein